MFSVAAMHLKIKSFFLARWYSWLSTFQRKYQN